MLMIKKCRFGCPPLELIGKASYHIFLAQMFYFYTCSDIYAAIENRWLEMGASLAITIIGGIVFYLVSQPIEKLCQNAVRSLIKKAPASNQNVTQS